MKNVMIRTIMKNVMIRTGMSLGWRMMDDVSVILHSGVVPVIIRCVSHNLGSTIRKFDRVLSLSLVLRLGL